MPSKENGGGPQRLQAEVMAAGRCVACGLCASLCPYIKWCGDLVRVVYSCGRDEGSCFAACPRVALEVASLDRHVFGRARTDHVLGEYRALYYARARTGFRAPGAQYGGTVTSLVAFALAARLVEGAVAVAAGADGGATPVLVREPEGVKRCAGSRYIAVPSLVALSEARRLALSRVAVVGRPCQVEAVRRYELACGENGMKNWLVGPVITIGLFCFWALSAGFREFLQSRVGREIRRVDVPPGGLVAEGAAGRVTIPLEEVRPYIKPACQFCFDPTAEWADLAVGSTEVEEDWNTLIVRTAAGEELVAEAERRGVIELRPYPPERLPLLRGAVLQKKRRVVEALGSEPASYLRLPFSYITAVKEG